MNAAVNAVMERPRQVTLKITQRLIDEATQKNSRTCMIAQAIRGIGGWSTHVTAESVSFNLGEKRYTYPLPPRAVVELLKFDKNKGAVSPFSIVLRGNTGFMRPVAQRPALGKRTQKRKYKTKPTGRPKGAPRRSERRYHGLRVIEVG